MIKPDGVQRGLIGEILGRLERRGLKIVGLKFMQVSRALAEEHYAVHKGKGFYEGLINYIVSAPVVACVIEGPNAIQSVRQMMGATRPHEAAPGSIRADLAVMVGRNLVHGSDGPDTAQTEIALWFKPDELTAWDRANDKWILE